MSSSRWRCNRTLWSAKSTEVDARTRVDVPLFPNICHVQSSDKLHAYGHRELVLCLLLLVGYLLVIFGRPRTEEAWLGVPYQIPNLDQKTDWDRILEVRKTIAKDQNALFRFWGRMENQDEYHQRNQHWWSKVRSPHWEWANVPRGETCGQPISERSTSGGNIKLEPRVVRRKFFNQVHTFERPFRTSQVRAWTGWVKLFPYMYKLLLYYNKV